MSDQTDDESEVTGTGDVEPVTRAEFNELIADVAKNKRDDMWSQAIILLVLFAMIVALTIAAVNLEEKVKTLAAQRDEVSSSYEPLLSILDAGPHCYDSGAEAVAAQTRIFNAIDLELLRDGIETRIDHRLNPGVGGSFDSPYMPVVPNVSKTSRDDRGKTCFTVSWPRDTKPRWAGGY